MSTIQADIVTTNGEESVLVVVPGDPNSPYVAADTHPNFRAIKRAAKRKDNTIVDLFDVGRTVGQKLGRLTKRVFHKDGRLFVDDVEMHSALTTHILKFMQEGNEDWKPLVRFFERLLANPNEHSRTQLYAWLDAEGFTINQDGMIVGYKGISREFTSINAGPGIVNGEEVNGHLDNSPGNVISVDRDYVNHNPSVGCSTGLHVGTHSYASGWGPQLVEVLVDPVNVVSVPTDCGAQKLRCCEYTVTRPLEARHETAVVRTSVWASPSTFLAPPATEGDFDHDFIVDEDDGVEYAD